jgi:hypothetical protein
MGSLPIFKVRLTTVTLIADTNNDRTKSERKSMKYIINKKIMIVALCFFAATLIGVLAGTRTPDKTNIAASCNCGTTTSGPCTYYESSKQTLCECHSSSCCEDIGSSVAITLKTYSGTCSAAGCVGTFQGSSGTSGPAKTTDCGA